MQLTDTLNHNTCSAREENFRLHVEKVEVTVTITFKSGGEMSPPSQTKLRLWCNYMHRPNIHYRHSKHRKLATVPPTQLMSFAVRLFTVVN